MKAHIAIIAITFLQVSAVPFLNNDRPSLLGSFQENVNSAISKGQDIINKGKEKIEEVIDNGKEVISEHVENVADKLEDLNPDQIANFVEEFPLTIEGDFSISPNDIIEGIKETVAQFENGISNITPENVASIIQENLGEISLNQENVDYIVGQMQNLQESALEVINANFALHQSICSQIRNAIKKSAEAFVEQTTKIVQSFQARLVNLIERGEVLPSRTLDVIEKSANDAINGFKKILKGLKVPEGIIENSISVMREATQKNMEIARTYVSYLGGSRLGEIVEEIKTAIGNGLPTDIAIKNVFTEEMEAAHERFHNLRVGNGKQMTSRNFFGDLMQVVNPFLDNGRLQEEMYEQRQRFEYYLRELHSKMYSAMVQLEEFGDESEGIFQHEIPSIIENSLLNIRENFQNALQNVNSIDELQVALGTSIADMEAEVGKVMHGIMQQLFDRIKYNTGNVMGTLEEIALNIQNSEWGSAWQPNDGFGFETPVEEIEFYPEGNGWGPEWQQNQGYESAYFYRPVEGNGGAAPGAAFSNNPDWSDPDRIFQTLI